MVKMRESLTLNFKQSVPASQNQASLEWRISNTPVPYPEAVDTMQQRASAIAAGKAREMIWLLEHPPLYTAGTSAKRTDLLQPKRFPVYQTGRGGQYTYHGPGQRIAYVLLDLSARTPDVRQFVCVLEQWIINTLAQFSVVAERREERVGVWVKRPDKPRLPDGKLHEDKIAALGIRVQKWVSLHGISINVSPNLEHFDGIVPCGVSGYGITSLAEFGNTASLKDVDLALKQEFTKLF